MLMTAAPLQALAQDERPVPPLPIDTKQVTVRDHSLKMRREGLRPISKLPELPDR